MIKLIKGIWVAALLLALFCIGATVADKLMLQENLIRFHVVANSDSESDQQLKLTVRDAVIDYLQGEMGSVKDATQARAYLQNSLKNIEQVANKTLQCSGSGYKASVSLGKEVFGRRDYETFSLPSGIYDSLRINIGSGQGKNWWCVVFPSLCMPATNDGFKERAVSAGFDSDLACTLSEDRGYEIRFFLLDCLGRLENLFSIG